MPPIDNQKIPSGELPEPQLNNAPPQSEGQGFAEREDTYGQAVEQGQPMSNPPPAAPPAPLPQTVPQASNGQPPVGQPMSTTTMQTPQIADDTDLIEKEWIVKAKQIVEQTKADPFNQNIEMNKMKADYLKKRYNKDVKVVEV